MKLLRQLALAAILSSLSCAAAWADVVVVVDAKSAIDHLTQDQVINIFLGRHRKLPSGIAALPVDQPVEGNLRGEFYRKLVNKELTEINAYWARLYFSGKTTPPLQATSAAQVLAHVLGTPGGIGYIEKSQVDARVRVVLTFSP
jgi:ABC-type phosphate transport system substrate-binding protein